MKTRKLGATGDFPAGKLNETDEGAINIAVGVHPVGNTLIIDFGKPVVWIGMPKQQAIEFANNILDKAKRMTGVQ